MKGWATCTAFLFFAIALRAENTIAAYFATVKQLKFENAKATAALEKDSTLRAELIQFADLLFWAGQTKRNYTLADEKTLTHGDGHKTVSIVRLLSAGYCDLFYDEVKGNAYRYFYRAYQLANESGDTDLTRACLYAFLKYYGFEIAQNSDAYLPYLRHLERLRADATDDFWIAIYKVIFLSKSLTGVDSTYYRLAAALDKFEGALGETSPLLTYLYFEKALKFYGLHNLEKSIRFYQKTVDQSSVLPFLNTERFLSLIRLSFLETLQKNYQRARSYLKQARAERNQADTLRSSYYLNMYGSVLMRAENKNDSAYLLLNRAYAQDFQLDFRKNTLEINRLNVELETQEKENANLRLRVTRIWLASGLGATALVCFAIYLAYANQRTTNKVQARDANLRVEKLLKEQEVIGINAMLEGQEKERQSLANELHDNLGSVLTTLKFHFQAFRERSAREPSNDGSLIEKTNKLLDDAYQQVRAMAHLKNAGVNAQQGLLPSIKNFAAKVSNMNRLAIEVNDHGMDKRLDNSLELTVFRVVQELISNVIKHANASAVVINLTQYEDNINIMVEDNGNGFDPAEVKPSSGMGLHSIQKRIESRGGSVTIEAIPKKGTTVIINLPTV